MLYILDQIQGVIWRFITVLPLASILFEHMSSVKGLYDHIKVWNKCSNKNGLLWFDMDLYHTILYSTIQSILFFD